MLQNADLQNSIGVAAHYVIYTSITLKMEQKKRSDKRWMDNEVQANLRVFAEEAIQLDLSQN